jgi:hypothetical protein
MCEGLYTGENKIESHLYISASSYLNDGSCSDGHEDTHVSMHSARLGIPNNMRTAESVGMVTNLYLCREE